jgi:hypothetical protein
MNKQELIDLHRFRDTFNINLQKIKSICAVLNIVIDKQGSVQYIPLLNETRNRMNDCLLLYAIGEQEITGRLENTKSNELEENQYLICVDKAETGRTNYVFVLKNEGAITKKQKNTIDITPLITTEDKTADFIQALSLAISKSLSEAQKPITAPQQELYDAMGKKFLLTNEQLGKLLGLSKSTISSKPDEWRKLGFRYTKVKEEGSSTTLWKISQ